MRSSDRRNWRVFFSSGKGLSSIECKSQIITDFDDDKVEVKVEYAAINFKDLLAILGTIDAHFNIGLEAVGTVIHSGKDNEFNVGDRVFVFSTGCFQRYVQVSSKQLIKIPSHLSFLDASTMLVPYLSAISSHDCLDKINVKKVLVHSATGGVGLATVFLFKRYGIETFATCSKQHKEKYLRDFGIKNIYQSRTSNFVQDILSENEFGLDAVINTLPANRYLENISVLREYGVYLDLSLWDREDKNDFVNKLSKKSQSYMPLNLSINMPNFEHIRSAFIRELNDFGLDPLPHVLFDAKDARLAFQMMLDSDHIGRIVLDFSNIDNKKCFRSEVENAIEVGFSVREGCEIFSSCISSHYSQIALTKNCHRLHVAGVDNASRGSGRRDCFIEQSDLISTGSLSDYLLSIWKAYFRRNDVRVDDDFEAMGGDSLSAVEVASLIKEKLNMDISPYSLLEKPTIRLLSSYILSDESNFCIEKLRYDEKNTIDLVLIHPGHGEIMQYKKLSDRMDLPINIWAIENKIFNDLANPFNTIEELAARYFEKLITILNPQNKRILGGWSYGGNVSIEVARHFIAQGISVHEIWLIDSWAFYNKHLRDRAYFNEVYIDRPKVGSDLEYIKVWSDLHWNRVNILLDYKPTFLPVDIVLFKANELDFEYKDIDEVSNYWNSIFQSALTIHPVKGNHSTLLELNNIGDIVTKMKLQFFSAGFF